MAKEADKLINETLVLIATLVCMKDRQRWEGKMQVVEGVELDLRGMEWFMENPALWAGLHDRVRGDIRFSTSEAAGRLLCMGTFLHEAYPCMDQHGVLGTEGDSGGGHRQVQATVSIRVRGGGDGEVESHLQDRVEEAPAGAGEGQEEKQMMGESWKWCMLVPTLIL